MLVLVLVLVLQLLLLLLVVVVVVVVVVVLLFYFSTLGSSTLNMLRKKSFPASLIVFSGMIPMIFAGRPLIIA